MKKERKIGILACDPALGDKLQNLDFGGNGSKLFLSVVILNGATAAVFRFCIIKIVES